MVIARRRAQSGYALLTVLFLAALAVIMIGMAVPRAAFEAQRAKEEDLMYRGSQYARAVQLYFRKFRRYPARIEELENTNSVRFLRKRYVDPITKKDEWRFIHMGPAGMFTDSLVYDKPKKKKEGEPESTSSSASQPVLDPTAPGFGPGVGTPLTGMADRLRATNMAGAQQGAFPGGVPQPDGSGGPVPAPMYFNQPGGVNQPGASAFPAQPGVGGFPGQPGVPQGTVITPGAFPQGAYPPGANPGTFPGAAAGQAMPGAGFLGGPGSGPRPGNMPGVMSPYPPQQPTSFGASGVPQVSNEAARLIGQLLTTPRPGGLAGLQPAGQASAFGGVAAGGGGFGGGIAGVASKSEGRGIKVYMERETYNEWEFVYDYRKDPLLMGAMAAGGMQGMGQPGTTHHPGTQSGFGQPGFGQPGFGQPGFGQPGFGQPGQVPITPINPMQPGLPGAPFGAPGGRPGVPPPQPQFPPRQ